MTDADTPPSPEQPPQIRTICGFWRRVLAFALDCLLLEIVGLCLGLAFYADFARMGGYGRFVGFAIALAYFAVLNSSVGGGQTVGKRIMKVEVVDLAGRHISPARSAIRYAVLGAPFFLDGAPIGTSHKAMLMLAGFAVVGIGPSIVYLFVFNRRTRQSLHDVAVGTFVVDAKGEGAPAPAPLWRPHLYVVGCLALGAALLMAASFPLARFVSRLGFLSGLEAVQARVAGSGEFFSVGVNKGINVAYKSGAATTTKTLSVTAAVLSRASLSETAARRAASLVLDSYPGAYDENLLSVKLRYGYDIGIASSWITKNFEHSPPEWRQMTAAAP